MKKLILILNALFISLIIFSCDFSFNSTKKGTLSLRFDSDAQKSFWGPVLDIASYKLEGTGPGGENISESWEESSSHDIPNLIVGIWNFSLYGIDSGNNTIAKTDFEIEIRPNAVVEKYITLTPFDTGQGSLLISIDFSGFNGSLTAPNILIQYEKSDTGDTGSIESSISEKTASASASMNVGYYLLYIKLADGGSVKYVWNPQAIRIAANKETEVFLECESNSTGGGAEIVFDGNINQAKYLDFEGKQSIRLSVKNVSSGQLFINKANVSSNAITASDTGGVLLSTESEKSMQNKNGFSSTADKAISSAILLSDNPRAQAFVPPSIREEKKKATLGPEEVIKIGEDDPTLIVGTSTARFWVEDQYGNWIQEESRLLAKADTVYLWIPDKYVSSSSTANNDNKVNQSQINLLKEKFNGASPYTGTEGIRALVSNIFGTEDGGELDGNGGIDADQHISILLYDIDYDYESSQTGGVLGYFWEKDEYSDAQMQAYGLRSNEKEMFYLDVHFLDRFPMIMVSCLSHEYQHMIHFNQKCLIRGVDSPVWFNEMCSMVAEDFIGSLVGIPEDGSPRTRIPMFNRFYHQSGVVDWLSGSDVLKSYASSYAFEAFLARNFGGAELFHDMLIRSEVGTDAVTSSVKKLGTADSFDDIFKKYATAFVFDHPNRPDVFSFPELYSMYNGIEYFLPAFSLWNYSPTPTLFSPSTQSALRPYGNTLHTSSDWIDLPDDSILNIQKPKNDNVNFIVMYKKR